MSGESIEPRLDLFHLVLAGGDLGHWFPFRLVVLRLLVNARHRPIGRRVADGKHAANAAPADGGTGASKLGLPEQRPLALELIIGAPRLLGKVAFPDLHTLVLAHGGNVIRHDTVVSAPGDIADGFLVLALRCQFLDALKLAGLKGPDFDFAVGASADKSLLGDGVGLLVSSNVDALGLE